MTSTHPSSWKALYILCLGAFMIVLDTTIINIALPSIAAELHFSQSALAWVVNAYLLMFGGLLILAGRLGDIYGYRKLFVGGVVLFTLASFLAGISSVQWMLLVARALQGIAAAFVDAIALSLVVRLFQEPTDRAKAMGIFGFVTSAGGSVGVFLGGVVVSVLNWHWVFFINVPVGILVIALAYRYVPAMRAELASQRVDIAGSVLITSSLMCAVYAIVNGNDFGWASTQTLAVFAAAIILFIAFVMTERRVNNPLIPFSLFRSKTVVVSNIMGVLWAASGFAWFFLSALYLQLVLNYSPLQIGLSFLPGNIIMAIFSISISAKIVSRFGIKRPLMFGMFLIALGLFLFSLSPVNGNFWFNVLPGMVVIGFGSGIAFNPLLLSAMSDVPEEESGLASGLINTSFMMGGALGLAILASLAQFVTSAQLDHSGTLPHALTGGYDAAFLAGALSSFIAVVLAFVFISNTKPSGSTSVSH